MIKPINKQKMTLIIAAVFFAIEILFFIAVQFTENPLVKFSAISVCVIVGVCFFALNRKNILIVFALFSTLIADIFMVLLDNYYEIAVTFFLIAQVFYFIVIWNAASSKTERVLNIALRSAVVISFELITALVLRDKFNFLILLSVFYFSNLIGNFVFAFVHFKEMPLFGAGLFCFFLCDVNVAVYFMNLVVDLNAPLWLALANSPINLIWLFYIPSQVLLCLTIVFRKGAVEIAKGKSEICRAELLEPVE